MSTISLEILLNTKCPLCCEIENSHFSLSNISGRNKNHFIQRGSHFSLMNDINPLIDGHALFITNSHFNSFGQIPDNLINDFVEAKRKVDSYFSRRYEAYFLFEHGTFTPGAECGSCVSHAHIHYIPYNISMAKYLQPFSRAPLKVIHSNIATMRKSICGEYLYCENHNRECLLIENPTNPLPRQLIRMIMAKELSLPDWNWRSALSGLSQGGRNGNN